MKKLILLLMAITAWLAALTAQNPSSTIAAPGLDGNPAATGEIFSDTAPYIRRAPKHIDIGDATRKEFPSLQSLLDVDMKKYRLDYYNLDGGFLQTSRERIKEGQMNKQETEKFGKEYSMCKNLASNNFNVTYRESVQGSYDVTVNGSPADLKKVGSWKQIRHHASKAINKQNAEMVVFEFLSESKELHLELLKVKKMPWMVDKKYCTTLKTDHNTYSFYKIGKPSFLGLTCGMNLAAHAYFDLQNYEK